MDLVGTWGGKEGAWLVRVRRDLIPTVGIPLHGHPPPAAWVPLPAASTFPEPPHAL